MNGFDEAFWKEVHYLFWCFWWLAFTAIGISIPRAYKVAGMLTIVCLGMAWLTRFVG